MLTGGVNLILDHRNMAENNAKRPRVHPMYSYWIHNVPGMTNIRIIKLLEQVGSSEQLYGWSEEQIAQKTTLSAEDIHSITASRTGKNLEAEWMKLMEMGISYVSMEQQEYPTRLRNIHNPPFGLYYKGSLPGSAAEANEQPTKCVAESAIPYRACPKAEAVAIVGSRSRSEYGLQLARQLGRTLGEANIAVISGLARGIDADAHIGALDGGGLTYAVLGCGVDICYPRSNQYLYDRILDSGGGIISEYPPGQKPLGALFPQRNRIISGLSDCIVVVEARRKSGSLITADYAMEQGKDVFAVPGRITDALSEGANRLIHEGAGIYIGPQEFLSDLNLGGNLVQQLSFCQKKLEKEEHVVYSILDFTPMGLGTILQKTDIPLEQLLEVLAALVEKGYIREPVPNYYVRVI